MEHQIGEDVHQLLIALGPQGGVVPLGGGGGAVDGDGHIVPVQQPGAPGEQQGRGGGSGNMRVFIRVRPPLSELGVRSDEIGVRSDEIGVGADMICPRHPT